ncbi:TFC7 [Symbiodinium natans]|uniref:TFC7 protein n=1 Tax=Symbiodinium natans TaxID=878477 RepID=A0A812L6V3_9DINO|nr:TFC7 [Symbiodinium natans]
MTTTVFLIRHGDRYDYEIGKEAWQARCSGAAYLKPSDPPLSALGHQQARDLAAHLKQEQIEAILVSPYLRALQTAQPLAQVTGLPLLVDFAIAESHQLPSVLPRVQMRLPYFPEIDETYVPMFSTVVTEGSDGQEPNREPRVEHMRRMLYVANQLQESPLLAGRRVALVTHAASVALLSALRREPLEKAGKLAPCGVCRFTLEPAGRVTVVAQGDDVSAYTKSSPSTRAWGFSDSNEPLDSTEELWKQALELGPTDITSLPLTVPAEAAETCSDVYEPESL